MVATFLGSDMIFMPKSHPRKRMTLCMKMFKGCNFIRGALQINWGVKPVSLVNEYKKFGVNYHRCFDYSVLVKTGLVKSAEGGHFKRLFQLQMCFFDQDSITA